MSEVQKFIKKYAETNKKFYITEVIDRIKNQDMIWVAYSPITHNYHMDICEGKAISFIFSEKEYYNVYADFLKLGNLGAGIFQFGIIAVPLCFEVSIFLFPFRNR